MASWLHYPNDDGSPFDPSFCADFTMITPQRRSEQVPPNFAYFARHGVRAEPVPLSRRESTIVDSCDTPAVMLTAVPETLRSSAEPTEGETGLTAPSTTFDEPDGSSSDVEPVREVAERDRKRKGREEEEWKYQNEVNELTQCCLVFFFLSRVIFSIQSRKFPMRCRHTVTQLYRSTAS